MKCVMLHGLGQTAQSWDKTAAEIGTDSFEIICPDLTELIRDKTPCWNELYKSVEGYCLNIGEPVNICGLSLGGILALQFCAEHSDAVNKAVLIGAQFVMPKFMLRVQNLIFRFMPQSAFNGTGFGKSEFLSLAKSMENLDFSGDLNKITCPTLIVCGEKDTANKKAAVQMSERISNSKLEIVPSSGHEVNVDAPAVLGKLLREFFGGS
ncbi:MAG: alpha/beta fold hydrolase [Ruminococcaceae bacterium]|nr:alpha/beta fold hydrolase [Oscillospiraceae bacterium]